MSVLRGGSNEETLLYDFPELNVPSSKARKGAGWPKELELDQGDSKFRLGCPLKKASQMSASLASERCATVCAIDPGGCAIIAQLTHSGYEAAASYFIMQYA